MNDTQGHNVNTEDNTVDDKNSKEMSLAIAEWPLNKNVSIVSNTKPVTSTLTQPISYNFQELPTDDNFFLQ